MSGTLRGHVHADAETVRRIEERIPDGYDVVVKSVPAWWLCYLHVAGGGRVHPGPLRVSRGLPLLDACLFALEHWVPLSVTTDAAGFITSMEPS